MSEKKRQRRRRRKDKERWARGRRLGGKGE